MSHQNVPEPLQPGGRVGPDPPPAIGPAAAHGLQPSWAPSSMPVIPGPMPDGPREYQQMLRGPRARWWRTLVAVPILLAVALFAQIVGIVPVIVAGLVAGVDDLGAWLSKELGNLASGEAIGPAGFLYVNLALIALIPAAGLSNWAAHHIRPRYLSSVVGGVRWRWLARCVVFLAPLWAIYFALLTVSAPSTSARPDHWLLLLGMALFLTPLQAAGEEYVFRGWLLQNVGSWFRRPLLGLVVGTIASAATFSAAHGSPDPWTLASLALFAVSACIATWRTGGLEAAIVIHAVHNVGGLGLAVTRGGWSDVFVSAETTSTPVAFLLDLALQAVALTLILWQAKRAGISRRYVPPLPVRWQPPLGTGPFGPAATAPAQQQPPFQQLPSQQPPFQQLPSQQQLPYAPGPQPPAD